MQYLVPQTEIKLEDEESAHQDYPHQMVMLHAVVASFLSSPDFDPSLPTYLTRSECLTYRHPVTLAEKK